MLTTIAFAALSLASPPSTEPPQEPPVWVVSDDPCPAGTSAVVTAGSSYEAGIWTRPDGSIIGAAREEDSCVVLIADDLYDAPLPELTDGVTEVRAVDGEPVIVHYDTTAPTYDVERTPSGGLPVTR